jgi:trehalose/maltose hydrolase-like predicted phosphorylase
LLDAADTLRESDPQRFDKLAVSLGFDEQEEAALRDFTERLYLPAPDPTTGVIEQFDGFLKLEDCSLETLKGRILHPTEYLGGGNGLATTTRIIKQADVVLLLHLLGDDFDERVKADNWLFYEPRTEHGSSLSACAYALVAARINRLDFAYRYFLKTATIDLAGKSKQFVGTLYIGGTHPAANGGAWMVATLGFGGMQTDSSGAHFHPRLPGNWQSLRFSLAWRGQRASVIIRPGSVRLQAHPDNSLPFRWSLREQVFACPPGQSREVPPARFT